MLSVAVPRRAAEHGDDDLRTEPADDAHHVLEDGVPRPVGPRLVEGLGVAEIVRTGEVLACSVQPPRREQLFGPEQAEGLAELGTDQVLPALAPVEGEVRGVRAHPTHEDGQELSVLVIGVRADHEDPLVVPQHPELAVERDRAAGGRRLELSRSGRGGSAAEEDGGYREEERAQTHRPRPRG